VKLGLCSGVSIYMYIGTIWAAAPSAALRGKRARLIAQHKSMTGT